MLEQAYAKTIRAVVTHAYSSNQSMRNIAYPIAASTQPATAATDAKPADLERISKSVLARSAAKEKTKNGPESWSEPILFTIAIERTMAAKRATQKIVLS